jgi:hypothetical protein
LIDSLTSDEITQSCSRGRPSGCAGAATRTNRSEPVADRAGGPS